MSGDGRVSEWVGAWMEDGWIFVLDDRVGMNEWVDG